MNVFCAGFLRNQSLRFWFHITSNTYHLVIFTHLLKLMNFRTTFAVVVLAGYASHRGFWYLPCFALIPDITHIADDGGTLHLQGSLVHQEVFHEEVFLHAIHAICWNEELFPTQWTRNLISWFLLLRFSCSIQTFKTECVNAWQHSWICECTHADRTFSYFSEVFCSLLKCFRHPDLSCEPIKQNKINNCSDEKYNMAVVHSKFILFITIT